VGAGIVGGDAVRVDEGAYAVEVRSDPPIAFQDVTVGNGEEVVLALGED
jgi:hypothetical protein